MTTPSPQHSWSVDAQKGLWGYLPRGAMLWNTGPREMQVLPLRNTLIPPPPTPAPGKTEVTYPPNNGLSQGLSTCGL